jgi:predicted nucleic acid-binding protein
MSKQKKPLLDSTSFIQYQRRITLNLADKMKLSIVVLYELTATTVDRETLKKAESLKIAALERGDLITPSMTDWLETAKMIRRLRFGEKSAAGGKTPKTPDAGRMQNDALIARNAAQNECYVVTANWDDFMKFTPFMPKLEVISAEDFFA